jgi:hypothetical protein
VDEKQSFSLLDALLERGFRLSTPQTFTLRGRRETKAVNRKPSLASGLPLILACVKKSPFLPKSAPIWANWQKRPFRALD